MSETHPAPAAASGSRGALIVVTLAALLAVLHLPYPLHEDQALFMYAAREMADGAQMYREFWDMKQPGIYWWYLASGSLFSFDAIGLRWMDLCWSVAVAWVLWAALRHRGALVAVLGPCLAFLSFYARTTQGHLSQVEWLVAGPIAVLLWCVGSESEAERRVAWRYAVAGAMVAVVALFKSMAALLPAAMLAVAMAHARWKDGASWRALLTERALPALLGCAVVLLPVAAWMQLNGTLAEALWTAFVYPPQAVREYAHSPAIQLFYSLRWFLVGAGVLLPWAFWAVYNGLRRGLRLELLCTAWAACAAVIIALQVLSFWEYHFDLLFVPVGLLAALGFADVLERVSTDDRPGRTGRTGYRRAAVGLLVLSVAASMGWPLVRKTARVMAAMPFSPAQQHAFNSALDERYAVFAASADAVKGLVQAPDRIIVWGDARLYFMVGRRPVVEVNGSTFYLAKQVEQVAELIRKSPPPLIYIGKHRNRMTFHGGGVLPRAVNELYEVRYEDVNGVWYQRRAGVSGVSGVGAVGG
jgi:hypothetical protein